MFKSLLLAAILAFQFNTCECHADERGLPLVEESVDELMIITTEGCDYSRIVFIRNGSILATRLMADDMLWVTDKDGFMLIWQDYWTAKRVVHTPKISQYTLQADPTQEGQDGLWWCMFRNMRDLKQP